MKTPPHVVIAGGGTAGWMCAAALSSVLGPDLCRVTLIESSGIGTVGVGEATLPHIKEFNSYIGIDEAEFMKRTNATFKLGIEFVDWNKPGDSYIHPFGTFGQAFAGTQFIHHWIKGRKGGYAAPLEAYSYAIMAARARRFEFPDDDPDSVRSTYAYAYHFDASQYAAVLRAHAEAHGVRRLDDKILDVQTDANGGRIESLQLEKNGVVKGDLFLDCSGFRSLLAGQALHGGWEDWSSWLPCNHAWAVPCESGEPLTAYTRATAREAGWQWRIQLQHRVGNGYVFSDAFIDPQTALDHLLRRLEGKPMAEPKLLTFKTGRRSRAWNGNCISVGLASGFLEPLESTSIYLIQVAINHLIQLFPHAGMDARLSAEFNRRVDLEYDRVRDFLILHYHANAREGELWAYARNMQTPDSLKEIMERFRRRGYVRKYREGLFADPSWLAILVGQGVMPEGYDRTADNPGEDRMRAWLSDLERRIAVNVEAMPDHADFVRDYCASPILAEATS